MALPHLTDEQTRTWTREQKDRWWLENVYRGNMPQLTLRAGITGFFLGGILSATNLYIGAKTGWTLGVGVTSVILSFVVFRLASWILPILLPRFAPGGGLRLLYLLLVLPFMVFPTAAVAAAVFVGSLLLATQKLAGEPATIGGKVITAWALTTVVLAVSARRLLSSLANDMTILENNAVQSIATAAGYMTGPLISALMAYMFVTNTTMEWHKMLIWNVVASILGVLVAFPMKRRFINDEQQPFPEGRACAVVLDSLYPEAPAGGTRNLDPEGMPIERTEGRAADGAVGAGIFKAKALGYAAGIGALCQMLVAAGYMAVLQISVLGTSKAKDTLVHLIPERLDKWIYDRGWIPSISGISLEKLGITLAFDLSMFGAGGLMGMRIANSLVIGMVLNFAVLAPVMIHQGEILPKNFAAIAAADGSYDMAAATFGRAHLTNSWCLWWGVSMMLTASMFGLFAKPKVLLSAFAAPFASKAKDGGDCLRGIELPLKVSFIGIPIFSAIIIWLNHEWFGVDPWLGALSIPLIIVLTLIAANATALTSTTPTGSLSKITQFTFGALQPTNPGTNLMTAGVTTEVASNASNLLMDIKPGYMLGAKPRQQAWGHCIGILAGALASTPLFFVLFMSNKAPGTSIETHITDQWAVPGALQWAAISKVIEGMGKNPEGMPLVQTVDGIQKLWGVLPVSAAWAMMWGAVAAIALEVLRAASRGRFPLSAVGIGLGVVLPPESTVMMWLGAAFFSMMEHRYLQRAGEFGWKLWVDSKEAVCAGLIAGWALLGIGDGLIAAFVPYPEDTPAAVAPAEPPAPAAPAPYPEPAPQPQPPPAPAANP